MVTASVITSSSPSLDNIVVKLVRHRGDAIAVTIPTITWYTIAVTMPSIMITWNVTRGTSSP